MKKEIMSIRDWLIDKLGGRKLTIVFLDNKHGMVLSSTTIPVLRDTIVTKMHGRTVYIYSNGEVKGVEL